MAIFTDSKGLQWSLEIKVRDIERVKAHVSGINGKPVDLLEIAEKGDFSAVSGSVQTVLQVVFWLLLDDIMSHFDRAQWDADHAALYEMVPDEKRKTVLQKAADWFGERIGGEEVLALVKAWEAAILDFIPSPHVRSAVQNVMDKQEAYNQKLFEAAEKKALNELQQNEERLDASSSNSPEKSASTRRRSHSAS